MSGKTPHPNQSSEASGFATDAWASIAVTSSGKVIKTSDGSPTPAETTPNKEAGQTNQRSATTKRATSLGENGRGNLQPGGTPTTQSQAAAPSRPESRGMQRSGESRHSRWRTDVESRSTKRAAVLLRYPFLGELVHCHGSVATLRNDKGEGIAHIRGQFGSDQQTLDGLDGKKCAFAIGGSPVRFREGKPWEHAVVQWILLDAIEEGMTPEVYSTERRKELACLDNARLSDMLAAQWYVSAWEQKTGEKPKALLHTDDSLDQTLDNALSRCSCLEELIHLLGAIFTSPYYVLDAISRLKAYTRFFQPSKWSQSVFLPNRPPKECRFYIDVWPLCGTAIQEHMARAKTVAIDLEAEGKRIWEYGWKNAAGIGLKSAPNDLSEADLNAALNESLLSLQSPCIVGHNLLSWDLPILRARNISFPDRSELWDTLLAAWLLKPWEHSHALIVAEHGHRADADAAKCCELFNEQMVALAPCLDGQDRDIRRFVDRLLDGHAALSGVKDRRYPADLQKNIAESALYPRNRLKSISWQQGCRVQYLTPEERMRDPVMLPDVCARFARDSGDIKTKVVSVIVADAETNMVQVRLSMLPPWLVDDATRISLQNAHIEHEPVLDDAKWRNVYIAEDLFTQPADNCLSWIKDQKLALAHPFEVLQAWQRVYSRDLSEDEVRVEFHGASEGRTRRAVLAVKDNARGPAWLLYEPPGLGESSSTWHLLPSIPDGLSPGNAAGVARIDLNAWAAMPRWKDGTVSSLDIDRLFVTPDTANRTLYLADIVHSVLNLQKALSEDQILICAMRWPCEADSLQKSLTQLSFSVLHADSPLRQIERLRKEGLRIIACSHADLPKYLDSARALGQKIRIVLDELPLHNWYSMLHTPEEPTRAPLQPVRETPDDESGEGTETDETNEIGTLDSNAVAEIKLKCQDIQEGVAVFLADWLGSLLKSECAPNSPMIILDSRLFNQPASRTINIQRENLPFYSLDELLDEKQRDVYHAVCFPRRPDEEVPNSYESYQAFLKKNWGYPDFLAGTQRPAIEALIGSRRDLLLRLPTGAGKSEVFQVPALLRSDATRRLSIVITPLRALMQDQVQRLWMRHFRESVDFLSGGREAWVNYDVYQGVLDGRIKLLYVSPERFRVPRFTEALERRRRMDGGLEFLVFDEAHCVSEWGFEFRPDYLFAAKYVAEWFRTKELPGNPHRLLLTSATVTRRNQQDLERELGLHPEAYDDLPKDMPHPIQPFIVLESCDLPESDEPATDDKFKKIVDILAKLDFSQSTALVFARKREHCHRISEALNAYATAPGSSLTKVNSLPFHAGLPETVKAEATELLKAQTVNVLVCTKAFGMGMDVQHLHACIHYRPPTFIEDYLQEVGRIGRSRESRERAGRDQVVATLLFNHDNLEQNLGLLQDKAIKPPDLQDFFSYCVQHSVPFKQVGKAVCILPAAIRINDSKSFDDNQVTNCLFWLERMGILVVEGRHPPFLDLSLNIGNLRKISTADTASAAVARALLGLIDETMRVVVDQSAPDSSKKDPKAAESTFSRFIRGLVRGVLALLTPPEPVPAADGPSPVPAPVAAGKKGDAAEMAVSVSMAELMAVNGGISADELYARLIDLSQLKALSLRKTIVMVRAAVPSTDEFWPLLEYAVNRLLRPTGGGVEILPRKAFEEELKRWYRDQLLSVTPANELANAGSATNKIAETAHKRRIQREVYRAMGSSLKIIRYSGLDLQESLAKDGSTQYARVVPVASTAEAQRGARERLEAIRQLVTELRNRDPQSGGGKKASFEVGLVDIVNALGKDTRVSRLRELINLVEASGFFGLENTSDEWVSVVSLNRLTPLPVHDPEVLVANAVSQREAPEDIQRVQATYMEMLEKHELQVLRAQCMVLFTAIPTENRKQFIDRYFQCIAASELQGLLQDNVGSVTDEVLANNPMLSNLREDVRRERFSQKLAELNDNQSAVCVAPFSKKLLVNAGPGSGKTHVLMMRCAHLIHVQHINPAEILVLAFNRAVVFEIRDRIRDLFRSLGYGNAVNKLDVSTFHSFALRHQQSDDIYEEDAIGEAVHKFAKAMDSQTYVQGIAGKYKAVLIDEFQDMNEDFYAVVNALATHCQGGVMVIGDDDQDILTWNRKQWARRYNVNCPMAAVHYFEQFRAAFSPEEHALHLNYRSVPEIVNRANGMIAKVSQQLPFARMKAAVNLTAFRTESGEVMLPFDSQTLGNIVQNVVDRRTGDGKIETLAILCRSNRDCRKVRERLVAKDHIAADRLDLLGSQDFALYQLRHAGAIMDLCAMRDEWDFVEPYTWDDIIEEYKQLNHADVSRGIENLKALYQLIRQERGRPRIRDVIAFVQEMRSSDVERLKAKAGIAAQAQKVTISTVHKVKGLEYDSVVVMPSFEKFPLNARGRNPDIIPDAAEEARLYYVGMTRARSRLYAGWPDGGRECAWSEGRIFDDHSGTSRLLKGSPEEIVVSWSGRGINVEKGVQDHIARRVNIDDELNLTDMNEEYGRGVKHEGKLIGILTGAPPHASKLCVSNVIRYSCGEFFRKKHPDKWNELHATVRKQKWFYTVLVESCPSDFAPAPQALITPNTVVRHATSVQHFRDRRDALEFARTNPGWRCTGNGNNGWIVKPPSGQAVC